MTIEKREALARKIRALKDKTVARGCTEDEAKQAAALADKLMRDYGLTLDEIQAAPDKDDLCVRDHVQTGERHRSPMHPVCYTQGAIAAYTNTRSWRNGSRLIYFGLQADVEVAKYLSSIFQAAMDFEFQRYWEEVHYYSFDHVNTARKGFKLGMAQRLNTRLKALVAEREAREQAAGENDCRALAVVKHQIVQHAYDQLGLKLHKVRTNQYDGGVSHVQAGRKAGDNVNIPSGGIKDADQKRRLK